MLYSMVFVRSFYGFKLTEEGGYQLDLDFHISIRIAMRNFTTKK